MKTEEDIQTLWESLPDAPEDHDYFKQKDLKPHGCKIDGNSIVIPLVNESGSIQSLQYINLDSKDFFQKGLSTKNSFYVLHDNITLTTKSRALSSSERKAKSRAEKSQKEWIDPRKMDPFVHSFATIKDLSNAETIAICKDFETAATINESTRWPTVVAFYAERLESIAKAVRSLCPSANIFICEDRETCGGDEELAKNAACSSRGIAIFPPGEYFNWNDYAVRAGKVIVYTYLQETILRIIEHGSWENYALSEGILRQYNPNTEEMFFNLTEKGSPRAACAHNLHEVLTKDPDFSKRFRFNSQKNQVEIDGRRWQDHDATLLSIQLAQKYQFSHNANMITDHVILIAKTKHAYNPLIDYLNSLEWDGTQRIREILPKILSTDDSKLTSEFLFRFLIASVARVFEPGCQVDTMLVLEGAQGLQKSKFCRVLFGEEYFTDGVEDISNKDTSALLAEKWCVEIPELEAFSKKEITAVKKWITRRVEEYRPSYGRCISHEPRKCVLIGTTNESNWLKDSTGGRRFWPIKCENVIDLHLLSMIRDQIFAEAVHYYNNGETWHLNDEMEILARERQEEIKEEDTWEEKIRTSLESWGDNRARISEILSNIIGIEIKDQTHNHKKRIACILGSMGWKSKNIRIPKENGGGVHRFWEKVK